MKIGIVTLVGDNYGNKFQNYAVEKLLSDYGDVETFQVERTNKVRETEKAIRKKLTLSYLLSVIQSRLLYYYDMNNACRPIVGNLAYFLTHKKRIESARTARKKSFEEFNKDYLHISSRVITHENCKENGWLDQFDAFVCGSDQIWNPYYATTSDLAFLSFAKHKLKVALSPSIGIESIPIEMKTLYSDGLMELDHLSIRELQGQHIIKELTGRDAALLCDPTLALSTNKWEGITQKPEMALPSHYLLCYFLGKFDKQRKHDIEEICKRRNLVAIRLFDVENPSVYRLGPNEVLYLLQHAEMVATDSYHGTVFSIIFHRPFQVFSRLEAGSSMSSRMQTLFSMFCISNSSGLIDPTPDDWQQIDAHREDESIKMLEYVKRAFSNGNY